MTRRRHGILTGALVALASIAGTSHAHELPATVEAHANLDITALTHRAIDAFDTPGMAVGVVKDGAVIHASGAGVRNMDTGAGVDETTLFRIASTTKAFTAAALAVLVDDGVLDWDDKVIDHLPNFRMSDPWVTREFTIRDLLTHRSGLGLGAGDMMLWPEPSGFTRDELIHNLRHLKPVSSFRSKYAYDNLLYIVAGEVVAAASDSSWEEVVQSRILDPLDMGCFAGDVPRAMRSETAVPYGRVDDAMTEITRNRIENASNISAAAGGLVCNIEGLTSWALTQLNGGMGPNGVRVFSEDQRDEMWKGQTILNVSASERELDRTHFKTYALGWRAEDMHGFEVISHTGSLSGFKAYVALVPELELGVVVLNNGSDYGASASVMQSVLKSYMGQPVTDWVAHYADQKAQWEAEWAAADKAAQDRRPTSGTVAQPLSAYAGTYEDPWFGRVDIVQAGSALRFRSRKMIKMVGTLEPFDHNTFVVRWDDREFRADAYMQFEADFAGKVTGATMEHVDPDGDWSFDFQDLGFTRLDD